MGEIDKKLKELHKIISSDIEWKKSVNIIKDEKQYRVNIPKKFADIMKINQTKDKLEFYLIPDENIKDRFILQAELIRE